MSATLTEQKQRLQFTECQLESTTRQLDESVEHREALQATCRTMEETLDRMREEMETRQNTFEERLQKKDVEVETVRVDSSLGLSGRRVNLSIQTTWVQIMGFSFVHWAVSLFHFT